MYTIYAGIINNALYKNWNDSSLNILTNSIFDFSIGNANNKSLSFASNSIPCDLYIPSTYVSIVVNIINSVSIMYVRFTFENSDANITA